MSTTKLGELTRDDLKALVWELMEEWLWELEQQMPDPDVGLTLRPEIAERCADLCRGGRRVSHWKKSNASWGKANDLTI